MEIQKYKARIAGTQDWVRGYPIEVREESGEGTYTGGTSVLLAVTEKSMPGGQYGTYRIEADSLKPWPVKEEAKRRIKERDMRKIFYNTHNCYADTAGEHPVVMAMDEDRFIKTVKHILSLLNVEVC